MAQLFKHSLLLLGEVILPSSCSKTHQENQHHQHLHLGVSGINQQHELTSPVMVRFPISRKGVVDRFDLEEHWSDQGEIVEILWWCTEACSRQQATGKILSIKTASTTTSTSTGLHAGAGHAENPYYRSTCGQSC